MTVTIRCIMILVKKHQLESAKELAAELAQLAEMIRVVTYDGMTGSAAFDKTDVRIEDKEQAELVISDDRYLIQDMATRETVCIGLDASGDTFFQGAALVVENLVDLDAKTVELTYAHEKCIPVTICETDRLMIREMTEAEIPRLIEIAHQPDKIYLQNPARGDFFTEESLGAYIRQMYRLMGYGIWGVHLINGPLIGTCGLAYEEERLELQYMLDQAYQHQGYAREMCQAVIEYASEYLEAHRLYAVIHEKNQASVRLARRLGFDRENTQGDLLYGNHNLFCKQ